MIDLEFISRSLTLKARSNFQLVGQADSSSVILGLHGWLDNLESFSVLQAQLKKLAFVALDLPGHGLSEHRHANATYNISDDLIDIANVIDAIPNERIHLLGHSRGAIMAVLFAAAMPEKIKSIILLDGLVPEPITDSHIASQLTMHIRDYRSAKSLRPFASLDQAIASRVKSSGLTAEQIRLLVERGVERRHDRKWHWRADSRLLYASSMKLNQSQNIALLKALQCPVLFCGFDGGYQQHHYLNDYLGHIQHLSTAKFDGGHHAHMRDQQALEIADCIVNFIHSHEK